MCERGEAGRWRRERERKGRRRGREMLLLSSFASAGYHGLLFVLANTLAK